MHRSPRVVLATAVAAALTGGLLAVASGPAAAAPARYADDFNGDGYRDLAVGMPEMRVGGKTRAGGVLVTFGSASGLTSGKRVLVTQNSKGVPGTAQTQDLFGSRVTSGDLDRDGYADLVVSAEGEKTKTGVGGVTVLWGGKTPFHEALALHDNPLYFGTDAVVADFTGDAAPELVVASTFGLHLYEGRFTHAKAPAPADISPFWDDEVNIADIAAGDLMQDGRAELVVTGSDPQTSLLRTLVYGSGSDPSDPAFVVRQTTDRAGTTLAVGDLDGDGYDDVALGLGRPKDEKTSTADPSGGAGYVTVLYGSERGVAKARKPKVFHQGTSGIPDGNESRDEFGASLSIADVNKDGRADLAVGIPGETLGGERLAGDVLLLRGASGGLTTKGAARFSQSTSGVPGTAEAADVFGSQVRLADFNRDGRADLAVSAPNENETSGALWQLHGTASGLTGKGADLFTPDSFGVAKGYALGDPLAE